MAHARVAQHGGTTISGLIVCRMSCANDEHFQFEPVS